MKESENEGSDSKNVKESKLHVDESNPENQVIEEVNVIENEQIINVNETPQLQNNQETEQTESTSTNNIEEIKHTITETPNIEIITPNLHDNTPTEADTKKIDNPIISLLQQVEPPKSEVSNMIKVLY